MTFPKVDHADKQVQVDIDGPFEPVARLFSSAEEHHDTSIQAIETFTQLAATAIGISSEFAEIVIPTAAWFVGKRLLGYSIQFVTTISPEPVKLEMKLFEPKTIGTKAN